MIAAAQKKPGSWKGIQVNTNLILGPLFALVCIYCQWLTFELNLDLQTSINGCLGDGSLLNFFLLHTDQPPSSFTV